MAAHDGNGWVECRCGQRHWGLHGAAGLLLLRDGAGDPTDGGAGTDVLLQLRAGWTHEGGSWGLPGGARDSHEDVVTAALREAWEEAAVPADAVAVIGSRLGVDHVDWRYTYVLAKAPADVAVAPRTEESDELRWVGLDDVTALPLHPAFARAWPGLRDELG
ncbi:NUDIX domain-containing protein [Kineosporia sp. A_224]|uniref:NUDIX domain-containing protein n=1 Tax=Kineosporia sp. A_224 TaxID=1962180 RepID=UPI000B4C14CF|nr:NUDIX hydrolase [Kineosporia sp. A_224]